MISYCGHKHSIPDPAAAALSIHQLSAGYGRDDNKALDNVCLTVPIGSTFALVGPNGAGKSTLFKVISGLLPAHQGTVNVFGHPLGACHHRVVYLPQRSDIDWQFPINVSELVMMGRYVYLGWFSRPSMKDQRSVEESLEELGIQDLAKRQISQLSGGQQQRVLIARALAQNADLLLLDEPLNAVDAATRDIVARVLTDLKKAGKTVVMATHYYDSSEKYYDGVVYLKDGQLVDSSITPTTHKGCDH